MIERTYYCDRKGCNTHGPGSEFHTVSEMRNGGDLHFCTWDCVLKFAAEVVESTLTIVEEAAVVGTFTLPEIQTPEEIPSLEELYASVRGATGTPQTTPFVPKFTISFAEVDLTLEDIWPNRDAPDNPTPEDVIEVMKETEYAHPMTVTSAWRLIDTLYVRHYTDEHGDMGVEWDGT